MTRILETSDQVKSGSGRLLVLAGEPGIGKTRLAQEVTLVLREQGWLVAVGRCYEPGQAVPYYPFLDILDQAVRAASEGVRSTISQRWPLLGRLLPDQLVRSLDPFELNPDEQQRLFWTVGSFLVTLAESGPVALLLEDLHWADESSLHLLMHLARQTRSSSVLLLGTYRDLAMDPHGSLARTLSGLHHEVLEDRIVVQPLQQAGTAALAAGWLGEGEVSSELVQLVYRYTEGNPFYTQGVLRNLVERGELYREQGRWRQRDIDEIEVPASVRTVVAERLSRLSVSAQEALSIASVLGQTFAFENLAAMGSQQEDDLEEAIDQAQRAGLVRPVGKDAFTFTHALIQQVLYGELSPRRQRRLHLAAGDALEQLSERDRQERAAELARHFLQSDAAERALPHALLAGDRAVAVFAHGEARYHYQTSADVARRLDNEMRLAEALEKLGGTLKILAENDRALDLLEEALLLYVGAEDVEGQARVVAQIGLVQRQSGHPHAGVERIQALLGGIEPGRSSRGLASLYGALADILFGSGRYAESQTAAQQAEKLARAVGDTWTLARAEMRRGTDLHLLGDSDTGRQVLEQAVARTEANGDLDCLGRALNNIANTYHVEGEFERAGAFYHRALDVIERAGDPARCAFQMVNLAELDIHRGEWTEAAGHVRKADAILNLLGTTWVSPYPLLYLGQLHALQGQWNKARSELEKCVTLSEGAGDLQVVRRVQNLLAEVDILNGQPGAALSRLEPFLEASHLTESDVIPLLVTVAWAHLEVGDMTRAEGVATGAITQCGENNRLVLVDTLRVHGAILTRQGRWIEAGAALEKAIKVAHRMPYPYATARALYQHGLLHIERCEAGPAQVRLQEALHIFQRLSAYPYMEQTDRALAQLP